MNSYENGLHSEVIDLDNEYMRCPELPNPAYQVQGAAGGLVRGKPMICGGFYESPLSGGYNKCFILGDTHLITMEHERSYPSSISMSRDQVNHFDYLHLLPINLPNPITIFSPISYGSQVAILQNIHLKL